jgi:hypothetical protein
MARPPSGVSLRTIIFDIPYLSASLDFHETASYTHTHTHTQNLSWLERRSAPRPQRSSFWKSWGHCPWPHFVANRTYTLYSPLKIDRNCWGTCHLHLQDRRISKEGPAYYLLHAGLCLTYSLTLKIGVTRFSEIQQKIEFFCNLRRENLKSYNKI